MDWGQVTIMAAGLAAYSLVSGRLRSTPLTAPIAFVLIGLAMGPAGLGVAEFDADHAAVELIAEFTLVLVLFSDAARIDVRQLARDHVLPIRMLSVGMPLTILAGAGAALVVFPEFGIFEAGLLAAILAPTDAALGQAVVSDEAVPVRVRQALNVESGLNDGIALPVVLILASLGSVMAAHAEEARGLVEWGAFIALQLGLGPLVGGVAGTFGGRLIDRCTANGWLDESYEGVAALAVAIISYTGAVQVGGNGFIAAFVAGLCLGASVRHKCEFLYGFMENEGRLLTLLTFTIFGAAMLPEALENASTAAVLYAALALTLLRVIPVVISLIGVRIGVATNLFLGWFGPRGLASILFALLILEEADIPNGEKILTITVLTVALSTLLHGATAAPLARAYGMLFKDQKPCEELKPTSEAPVRT